MSAYVGDIQSPAPRKFPLYVQRPVLRSSGLDLHREEAGAAAHALIQAQCCTGRREHAQREWIAYVGEERQTVIVGGVDSGVLTETGLVIAGDTTIVGNKWFAVDAPTGPDHGLRAQRIGEPNPRQEVPRIAVPEIPVAGSDPGISAEHVETGDGGLSGYDDNSIGQIIRCQIGCKRRLCRCLRRVGRRQIETANISVKALRWRSFILVAQAEIQGKFWR